MSTGPYAQARFITPKTIYNTVLSDGQTRLWLRRLLYSPEIIKALQGANNALKHYQRDRLLSLIGAFLLALSSMICLSTLFLNKEFFSALIGLALAIMAGSAFCLLKRRPHLASLAAIFVEIKQADFPPGTTLYQMGEICARQYGTPSLVGIIWTWDHMLKNTFILLYVATFGVFFLSFAEKILWISLGCFLTIYMVKVFILQPKAT